MVESLLTIVPRYGLANRMRALASGLILGETLGYKSCVYWEENELCNCSFKKLFDSDLIEVGRPLMETSENQVFFSKEEMEPIIKSIKSISPISFENGPLAFFILGRL